LTALSLENPLFRAYVIAAALMILKMMAMAWLTVYRMLRVDAGYRAPEDARAGLLNRKPVVGQTDKNEYVERIRRIHQNDGENVPLFLAAGLLFVLVIDPAHAGQVQVGQALMGTYVVSRLAHFGAYLTAQSHEVRATLWTLGSLIVLVLTAMPLGIAVLR